MGTDLDIEQRRKAELFRSLHSGDEMLVLPNAWDAISARIVEAEGFPAIASTSAGLAAVLGYPDGQVIPRHEMFFLIGKMARAVDIPMTADIEAGYEDAAQTARDVIASGAVGMNIEDMVENQLLALPVQLANLRAVRAVAEQSGVPLVINARTDIFLARHGDPGTRLERAVERLNAFHDEGADCLFAPGVVDAETIGRLVSAVKGPLNILATVGSPPLAELKRLGVRRVSLGSGLSRVGLGAVRACLQTLRADGSLAALSAQAISYEYLQKLLSPVLSAE